MNTMYCWHRHEAGARRVPEVLRMYAFLELIIRIELTVSNSVTLRSMKA